MSDIGWPPMDWKLFEQRLHEIREHYDAGRISKLTLELAQMVGFLADKIKDKDNYLYQKIGIYPAPKKVQKGDLDENFME